MDCSSFIAPVLVAICIIPFSWMFPREMAGENSLIENANYNYYEILSCAGDKPTGKWMNRIGCSTQSM